jgi:hypothetical protein
LRHDQPAPDDTAASIPQTVKNLSDHAQPAVAFAASAKVELP